ncbi:MAG: hypothetical protein HY667_03970 [Chloroflexi bacterium]|nr:hypothetical protein [Chloroflexota bacterium]
MSSHYEVLSPWAEADPVSLSGITPRIIDLSGRKIGFLRNNKRAAEAILAAIEKRIRQRFPTAEFSWYRGNTFSVLEFESHNKPKFEEWLKGVDAVVAAVGD